MPKIRTVKPELFRHCDLFEAELRSQLPLRLAFIGLFGCCDRAGRFRWEPRSLKLDILPYDDAINFDSVLTALWEAGFIKKYTYQNKYYGYIPTWSLHQSINQHEPASRLPEPQSESQPQPANSIHMPAYAMASSGVSQAPASETVPKSDFSSHTVPLNRVGISVSEEYPTNSSQSIDFYKINAAAPTLHMPAYAPHVHTSLEMEVEVEVEREVDMEQEKEMAMENKNLVAPARPCSSREADILQVFAYWQSTLNHPHAILDSKRHRLIDQALKQGYSVSQLCQAIEGCAQTPHNLGDNDRGQRYDGLHVIFRDADQIERFMENSRHPPRSKAVGGRLADNLAIGDQWLQRHARTMSAAVPVTSEEPVYATH